jgi:hypothetical protein
VPAAEAPWLGETDEPAGGCCDRVDPVCGASESGAGGSSGGGPWAAAGPPPESTIPNNITSIGRNIVRLSRIDSTRGKKTPALRFIGPRTSRKSVFFRVDLVDRRCGKLEVFLATPAAFCRMGHDSAGADSRRANEIRP